MPIQPSVCRDSITRPDITGKKTFAESWTALPGQLGRDASLFSRLAALPFVVTGRPDRIMTEYDQVVDRASQVNVT
jgi:hypothetical protein